MKSWSVKKIIDAIKASEILMKQKYEAHNTRVIATIPPENLLVWNLKDGWEPLCTFLVWFRNLFERLDPLPTVSMEFEVLRKLCEN